ncbi:hypothetical protein LIER_34092 [Lithospermum erythrorhizon]|uniref:Uncharacterized protein n=1 Tax=Lithospermum erythrorhizon TaxID=34254 RepID=A0AAV3RZD0_LITER
MRKGEQSTVFCRDLGRGNVFKHVIYLLYLPLELRYNILTAPGIVLSSWYLPFTSLRVMVDFMSVVPFERPFMSFTLACMTPSVVPIWGPTRGEGSGRIVFLVVITTLLVLVAKGTGWPFSSSLLSILPPFVIIPSTNSSTYDLGLW